MKLDEIRKLSVDARALAEIATPGPWETYRDDRGWAVVGTGGHAWVDVTGINPGMNAGHDATHIARSRTAVPAFCDAVEALLAVIDALPRCRVCWLPATKRSDQRPSVYCDIHFPVPYESSGGQRVSWYDLPHAAALRALLAGGAR